MSVDYIKNEIRRLYENAPNIHVSVKIVHPKVNLEDAPAVIIGMYRNIFQVEENSKGYPCRHTFQYGDILTGRVAVRELEFSPVSDKK